MDENMTLTKVGYSSKHSRVMLALSTGLLVEIPIASIKELCNLSESQLRALEPDNAGMTLSQRALDIDIWIPGMLAEVLKVKPSAMLGKKGGAKTSEAKRRASAANGRRGGRPKKKELVGARR